MSQGGNGGNIGLCSVVNAGLFSIGDSCISPSLVGAGARGGGGGSPYGCG